MSVLNNWDDVANPARVELVFEGRNKEYGAYVLRKEYSKRLSRALIWAITGVALAIGVPMVVSLISESGLLTKTKVDEVVNLAEPPPIDKTTPPPPPVEPPPPVQKTIQFTPPKIVKEEEMKEPPPTQEEVKDVQVSTVTQEGTNISDLPPENPVVAEDENKVFLTVEEMPTFQGDDCPPCDKLIQYIAKNIKYPAVARDNGIEGMVYVGFVVDKEGKVKDVKLQRGIGAGCDEEALRVIRGLPAWSPGRQNGRPAQVQYNIPVRFKLKSN